jgi:hypothetical protein
VSERQPLDFDDVVAGIEARVSRLDPRRAGMFLVRGTANADVLLTLALPSVLVGPGAEPLVIEFGADDAAVGQPSAPQQAMPFDPHLPRLARLPAGGRAVVFLGGRVRGAYGQRAGVYRAPVVLTVAYTGN